MVHEESWKKIDLFSLGKRNGRGAVFHQPEGFCGEDKSDSSQECTMKGQSTQCPTGKIPLVCKEKLCHHDCR